MRIPEHFVGVEALVAIASLAVHMDVGGKFHSPGEVVPSVQTIEEVPGGEVVGGLQTVAGACVGGVEIGGDVERPVSVTE